MKKNIETGQRFGRLVIVKEVEHHKMPSGRYRRMFLCRCDCGNEVTCSLANLTSGNTSSCGCLKKELASQNNSTHRQSKTRLYRCWLRIRNRCYRESNDNYAYYGGRGIKVCDEWKDSYENFSKWAIENGYKDTLTIDRIDYNGNYEPNNCRWITQKEQTRNTRGNTNVYLKGEGFNMHKFTLSELCEILKVNYPLSVKRIYQYLRKRKAVKWKQYIKDNADVLLKIAVEKFNSVQDTPFEQNPADLEEFINELSKQFPDVSFAKLSRIAVRTAKWAKPAWSEDDKKHIRDIMDYLFEYYRLAKDEDKDVADGVQNEIRWLQRIQERL